MLEQVAAQDQGDEGPTQCVLNFVSAADDGGDDWTSNTEGTCSPRGE